MMYKISFAVLILCGFLTNASLAACPKIIKRSEWNARPPLETTPLNERPAPYVVVHHSATRSCGTTKECKDLVKSIQNYHMDDNGWEDIGYTFLVGEDGNVYEGRGWGVKGAHAVAYNARSVGICVIGDFSSNKPNASAIRAVKDLIDCGLSSGEIGSGYRLLGHRQATATLCPGDTFYDLLKTWPHWTNTP